MFQSIHNAQNGKGKHRRTTTCAEGDMGTKKKSPQPNPTHRSLKPDGSDKNKGSYFRRIEDIQRGLEKISALPPGGKFLFLYYGCEKLAKGIVGINAEWEADDAYIQKLDLNDLKTAASAMQLPVTHTELDVIFLNKRTKNTSARYWRNEIAHNFGPSNVDNVIRYSAILNHRMQEFLEKCTPAVLNHLKRDDAN
jgi:hypothetical protein